MGKINVYDEIVLKKIKNRKYLNRTNCVHKFPSKKILEWNLQLAYAS